MRQLLIKLKGKDRSVLWQSLYQDWDGTWKGSFIGRDKRNLDQAGKVSMCLASHIRIILSHRGFTKKSIFKLIYASFDDLELNPCITPGGIKRDERFCREKRWGTTCSPC